MGKEVMPYWEGRMRFRPPAKRDPHDAQKVVAHSQVFAGSCKVYWTDLQQREREEQGQERQRRQQEGQVGDRSGSVPRR